jgi:hypothetical protein
MRRLFVPTVACAALLLLAAPALAGLTRQASGGRAPAPHVPRTATQSSRAFTPLGAQVSGSVTVSGKVYDASHSTSGNVPMKWWSWSESGQQWRGGSMTSRLDGSYSVSPAATGNGEIWAHPDEDTTFARLRQTWSAGSYPVDISPGTLDVSATRGGPWYAFDGLTLNIWGDHAYSSSHKATADSTTSPATARFDVLEGEYTRGSVNFSPDEGVEFSWALTVTAGATPSGTVPVSELDAQRVLLPGLTYSGRPGATVRVSRANFPAGWRNYVTGSSDPTGSPYQEYGSRVSRGGAGEPLSIKVPSTAKPGYSYWIGFQHVDAGGTLLPLYVETPYQVCTMQPSKTSVTRDARIRISGVVPTEGHWGSELGKRKSVVLWWHRGSAPVPTKWDPRGQGWIEAGSFKTTGSGSYRSPFVNVPRTGTFVVQYDSDDWYYGAYTSTARVTVR